MAERSSIVSMVVQNLHIQDQHPPEEAKRSFWDYLLVSPDHPSCLKYFRSPVSIRRERERQLEMSMFVIHPFSTFRKWYDLYLIYLYISTLITKSLDHGFSRRTHYERLTAYSVYTGITDILFVVDIIINFFTGYVTSSQTIELRRRFIARHYVFGNYFFCDVLSSIPKKSNLHPPSQPFRIEGNSLLIYTFVVVFTVVHWMACLQYGVPRIIRLYLLQEGQNQTWYFKQDIQNETLHMQYFYAFFKSTAYIFGARIIVLMKDSLPEEYILGIVTYFTGKVVIGSAWIVLAVAIVNSRSTRTKLFAIICQLNEYMKRKHLPQSLTDKITQYYHYNYQGQFVNDELISGLLSTRLRKEVKMHLCKSLTESVLIFSYLSPSELFDVVQHLKPEIFLPNDVIIQHGTFGDSMYFLSSGTVAVYSSAGREVCHLQDGDYFGEVSLISKGQLRTTTVLAIEVCQVYRLERKMFETCLFQNEKVRERMVAEVNRRMALTTLVDEEYKRILFEKTFQTIERPGETASK
ncbi:hypothetical protein NQ318_016968 [Aromia moschata]|uniref:Cyclic nucleotide-binding domain-containing protein n=1 Tax=Aromia moschata TaxID=1265417 RepID=A0AAV8YBZ7_9CUCU|nr:hypothetical protein NQ318_016968 [Aromia moschata]